MHISIAMKYFLQDNKELLEINPTQFLVEAENSEMWDIDAKALISFMNMFDKSDVEFDINQLFNSEAFPFPDKYFKKGSTQFEIESSFVNNIFNNPKLKDIVTEIPKESFKNLTKNEIHSAIKNSIMCTKLGNISEPVDRIYLQLLFDHDRYEIILSVVVESGKKAAYYNDIEKVGVWVPNYGFCINEEELYKQLKFVSENLISSLYLARVREF